MMAARIDDDAVPSLNLRAMRLDDLDAVLEIEHSRYPFPWRRKVFEDCLRAGYQGVVAYEGATLIGYGLLSLVLDEAHILNVCVARQHGGRGVGRRLVERLVNMARWCHAARVFLEVRESNVVAQRLYDGLGFERVGERPRYYPHENGRETAVIMALDLRHDQSAD